MIQPNDNVAVLFLSVQLNYCQVSQTGRLDDEGISSNKQAHLMCDANRKWERKITPAVLLMYHAKQQQQQHGNFDTKGSSGETRQQNAVNIN